MSSGPRRSSPPKLKSEHPLSLGTGIIFAAIVMLALPLSQLISGLRHAPPRQIDLVDFQPPDVPPEPPPPDEPDDDTQIEELQQDREPPTLDQLELAMNPDVSGFASGDFTIPDFTIAGSLADIIYEISDLSRPPRPIVRTSPTYPPELRNARISGEVVVEFVVRMDGSTSDIRIRSSTNPAFEEPTIREIRRWRFEPGERDGEAVNTRVRQRIPFQLN